MQLFHINEQQQIIEDLRKDNEQLKMRLEQGSTLLPGEYSTFFGDLFSATSFSPASYSSMGRVILLVRSILTLDLKFTPYIRDLWLFVLFLLDTKSNNISFCRTLKVCIIRDLWSRKYFSGHVADYCVFFLPLLRLCVWLFVNRHSRELSPMWTHRAVLPIVFPSTTIRFSSAKMQICQWLFNILLAQLIVGFYWGICNVCHCKGTYGGAPENGLPVSLTTPKIYLWHILQASHCIVVFFNCL